LVSRVAGKKSLVHYHSGEARDHFARSRIARDVVGAADGLVVPSGYLAAVFRGSGLNAVVVPNLLDLSQFSYRLREPLSPRLICSRGFHPYYGVDAVIRAFHVVQRDYPAARLCLLGQGRDEPTVRSLVAQFELKQVEFAGAIPHQEIARYYNENDIFINASWLDNAPVSILEAFASGTPVVTTAPEGMRYLVEHERTGLLCAPGDWLALAENVVRLLREPGLVSHLSRNAHEECQRHCWERVRPQWLEVYRSLCVSMRPAQERPAQSFVHCRPSKKVKLDIHQC
jgi:glycosyltransferase involved in cell wall biosynthesis